MAPALAERSATRRGGAGSGPTHSAEVQVLMTQGVTSQKLPNNILDQLEAVLAHLLALKLHSASDCMSRVIHLIVRVRLQRRLDAELEQPI